MGFLSGKRAFITGIASDRSIASDIADALVVIWGAWAVMTVAVLVIASVT